MSEPQWPYTLPIWRRHHQVASPDGVRIARINPAWEVSMGNPTSGMLCISPGPHIDRCNPSFLWSDDSQFLAVPQFFNWGPIRRQRVLVIAFGHCRVYASRCTAWYFQPESFTGGRLIVSMNPFGTNRKIEFAIPSELETAFFRRGMVPWPDDGEA